MVRFALTALLCLAGLAPLGAAAQNAGASTLTTAAAEYRTVPLERVFDATAEAVNQATVSAQIAGRVVAVLFDVHDFVPKGEVIVRFKDTEQRARLDAAQASLREAQARFGEARDEFDRVDRIFQQRLVAKSALDRAAADLKAARARLDAARAQAAQAKEQLDYTEVRAPYAGIVVKRFVEVGEAVSAGQPLMAGLSLEQLRLTATVPEQAVARLQPERGARVLLPQGRQISVDGDQVTVFPFADPASHTVRVRVVLPPRTAGVFPGMFAKVGFVTGEERRLLVPAAAVVRRSEVTGVYVVAPGGHVALRLVRVGAEYPPGQVEVLAGLEAGERVALEPLQAALRLKQSAPGASR